MSDWDRSCAGYKGTSERRESALPAEGREALESMVVPEPSYAECWLSRWPETTKCILPWFTEPEVKCHPKFFFLEQFIPRF